MAVHTLNALGEMCPVPNMMIREKLAELALGEVVVLETDHYCAKLTVAAEMKKLGHRVTVTQVAPGIWQIIVRKGR